MPTFFGVKLGKRPADKDSKGNQTLGSRSTDDLRGAAVYGRRSVSAPTDSRARASFYNLPEAVRSSTSAFRNIFKRHAKVDGSSERAKDAALAGDALEMLVDGQGSRIGMDSGVSDDGSDVVNGTWDMIDKTDPSIGAYAYEALNPLPVTEPSSPVTPGSSSAPSNEPDHRQDLSTDGQNDHTMTTEPAHPRTPLPFLPADVVRSHGRQESASVWAAATLRAIDPRPPQLTAPAPTDSLFDRQAVMSALANATGESIATPPRARAARADLYSPANPRRDVISIIYNGQPDSPSAAPPQVNKSRGQVRASHATPARMAAAPNLTFTEPTPCGSANVSVNSTGQSALDTSLLHVPDSVPAEEVPAEKIPVDIVYNSAPEGHIRMRTKSRSSRK